MADDLTRRDRDPYDPASEDAIAMCDGAMPGRPAGVPGSYDTGDSPRWSPETIANVHAMAQLGRCQLRGYSTFNHRMPGFDDLVFVPATMTRLPLEGYRESCETKTVLGDRPGLVSEPIRLDIPIYVASMSFGALSANAKAALGHGASKVGSMTCTGEGGMLEEERAASSKLVYQMTPSRYMLDLEHLRMADGIELAVGQGAKPGTGRRAPRHEGVRASRAHALASRRRGPRARPSATPTSWARTICRSRSRSCARPRDTGCRSS